MRTRSPLAGSDAVGWIAILAVALYAWLALWTGGRLPSADVPQHALALRRLLEGPGDLFIVRWEFPYLLLYALAAIPAQWTDPVSAVSCAGAFSIALLPVASAILARSFGRSPALGVFALLGAFTTVSGWGFYATVLGVSVCALAVSAAVRHARAPDATRGAVACLAIVAAYFAHPVAWAVALAAAWAITFVWQPQRSWRALAPLVLATAVTGALCTAWLARVRLPWLGRLMAATAERPDGPFPYRIVALSHFATAFGRVGELLAPWWLLAVCLASLVAWIALMRRRAQRRAARMPLVARARGQARAVPLRWRLRRTGPVAAWWTLIALYLCVPIWLGGVFLVYPRFLVFAAVLTPLLVARQSGRTTRLWGLAGVVPALWLVTGAANEVRLNAARTACIDRLLPEVRTGESMLTLAYQIDMPGYLQPLDLHVAAELAARRGGWVSLTFTDLATLPIDYAPGVDREVAPPNVSWDARAYDHERDGGEFTSWVLLHAPEPVEAVVAQTFGKGSYEVAHCGWLTVVRDTSAAAGSRPHRRHLPHRGTAK